MLLAAFPACMHEKTPNAPGQKMWLTIPDKRTIAIFPVDISEAPKPIARVVEDPPDQPVDVSTDFSQEIFVANVNGNVKAYSGHNDVYIRIHLIEGPNTRIVHPQAIAVDKVGSFYVADTGEGPGHARIEWFAGGMNGDVSPNRVLSGPQTQIVNPAGLATDGSGRLYVADQGANKVLVFAADADGDASPVAMIGGFHSPQRLFVDQFLTVFVTNKADNSVSVVENEGPENWNSGTTFTSDTLRDPAGIITDAGGRIAVAGRGGVIFFAANSSGPAQPVAILSLGSDLNPMGLSVR
jgi:serine/threonine protein kinase, bacterial